MLKKSILSISALALLILTQANSSLGASMAASQSGRNTPIPAGTNVDSIDVFYSYLAPYGRWFTLGNFGLVWVPTLVGPDWSPYADGKWEYTDSGWTWESDDPWGWASCHYGRWLLDATYGWVWIPGTIWSPAWVDWRRGRGYIGWAPLPPASAATEVAIPVSCYTFVEEPYFDNDEPYFDNDDNPKHHRGKNGEPRGGVKYLHLPASAGTDLRKWAPDIPVRTNRPPTPSAATNAAEKPQKSRPVEDGSNQAKGQYSSAHPRVEGNGTPAVQTAPGIHSGVERPNKSAPYQDNPIDVGRNGRAKAEQQPEGAYRHQAEEPHRRQDAQPQQAEEAGRRQAEETRRQQEAERQQAEEARRQQEAQQRQAEESRRQQEAQQRQAEESRRQQEAQQKQAEEAQRTKKP